MLHSFFSQVLKTTIRPITMVAEPVKTSCVGPWTRSPIAFPHPKLFKSLNRNIWLMPVKDISFALSVFCRISLTAKVHSATSTWRHCVNLEKCTRKACGGEELFLLFVIIWKTQLLTAYSLITINVTFSSVTSSLNCYGGIFFNEFVSIVLIFFDSEQCVNSACIS